MATKRTLPSDFETSSVPPKQSRIEGQAHPATLIASSSVSANPISQTSQIIAVKRESSEVKPPTTLKLSTGVFPATAQVAPSSLPVIPLAAQTLSPLTFPIPINRPLGLPIHVPASNIQSSIQKVTRLPTPAAGSPAHYMSPLQSPPSVPTILPPPYPVPTSISNVASGSDAVELTCSSPSQFLHPPLIVSSAVVSSSSPLSTVNVSGISRQPACSVDSKPSPAKSQITPKSIRSKIMKNRKAKGAMIKQKYETMLKEKFFLEGGGNLMDFPSWKKKPNLSLEQFLKSNSIDVSTTSSIVVTTKSTSSVESVSTPSAITIQIPLSTVSPSLHVTPPKGSTPISPSRSLTFPSSSPRPATRAHASFSSVYESSHEDIVMRARHEAEVMKAISELRKEGLWSASRLPKVQEPPKVKTHWDYLLEEMQWLAADFSNEKRWKINAARKLSRSVAHYHKERGMQQAKTEKEELLRLRKIASSIAKEVKYFWDSMQKIVEHKQQLILDAKKKKAMDLHLEFIVDQTAKYSDWLAKGLGNVAGSNSASEPSLTSASPLDDSEAFLSPPEESDDENTIEMEEQAQFEEGAMDYDDEINQLQHEGEIPLEDLLASLPKEILHGRIPDEGVQKVAVENLEVTKVTAVRKKAKDQRKQKSSMRKKDQGDLVQKPEMLSGSSSVPDKDYHMTSREEDLEDETTIEEQEVHEGEVDHDEEISALIKEGEESLDDLLERYNLLEGTQTPEDESVLDEFSEDQSSDDPSMYTGSDNGESGDEDEDIPINEEGGLEILVSGKKLEEACKTETGLNDVAAAAEKFQPKGITLATTEVKTAVPFLLKHKLREYQHIGLDWLVAIHERKLNGILADEMGLGKTIQTIALLAHLVCEKKIWGPHLIIVPTSVLLNWEYECKKWCPALKILTYFGSLKERKLKRIGWSKRNAFHICITSYNIAVTDHRALKQKKWKYLILDEAQNIKNFKSQRWQTLLNFNSQCRLLLTGTPLQNNLMELWSLMHFLMPAVFSSHTDFKEWFSNPLSGMVEGSQEYNESIIKRLHQVLRPFLLRRLKMEVEKQMPKKYEHVVPCRLSKRQRFLYDEYMSRGKTKDSLASGNYLSVINILMQLRKVCNHPDLFELRPIISPFEMEPLEFYTASCILNAIDHKPFEHVNLNDLNLMLCNYELEMDAFASFRTRQLQTPRMLFMDPHPTNHDFKDQADTHSFLEDLHVPLIEEKMQSWTLSRYRHMYEVSSRRCRRVPVYGRDLIYAVQRMNQPQKNLDLVLPRYWLWIGYSNCLNHQTNEFSYTCVTSFLQEVLSSVEHRVKQLEETLKRFLIYTPSCHTRSIKLHASHPQPSHYQRAIDTDHKLKTELVPRVAFLHPIATGNCFQFPERRLIQYDCGKLQTLDRLLQNLKIENHRVLIFTQMSRMLDILEIFLNYHGLTYLRLDGATPVQKRQYLMDRFNRDERVFCFILSTRSGGLGVNLTGADTVIFYDSDWNPTMDAQAQDRCHRIGQTRDVHIYRLICASTVEENILKKASQKRMLGDIAIEGGAFTTDFFKQVSLKELFVSESETVSKDNVDGTPSLGQEQASSSLSEKQIEELLLQAEDDGDAKAASKAKAEQLAEKAEFDESFALPDESLKVKHSDDEYAKAMSEFAVIEEQLNGIEKYAMYFLEEENAEYAAEQLRLAEENIELAKKDWELSHLQSLREEEEKEAVEETEDEVPLTYDRPEFCNKIYQEETSGEIMPIWLPPTPPSEDSDEYYVDTVLEMNYNTQSVISPAVLASIASFSEEDYDVFGLRRQSADTVPIKKVSKSSSKQIKEHVNVPPSLFWRRFTTDALSTKFKKLATHQKKIKTKDQFTPLLEQQPEGPEWTTNEDWILLKSITGVLEFPISLTISVPAQIPNWSVIADITSSLGRVRRSPLQCREHLMNVVIPREDGTVKGDEHAHEGKKHKSRDFSTKKSKSRKEQRTKSLVVHNNGKEHTKQYSSCFEWVIQASISRKQTPKFTWDTVQKPSMHSDLLKDYGVQTESVQSPMQIAQQRVERMQLEHPRHNQVPQLLSTQPYHTLSNPVRSYAAAQFSKPTVTDIPKLGYNIPRPVMPSPVQAAQKLQNSTVTFSPSKTTVSSTSTATSTAPTPSQLHPSSVATSLAATASKTYAGTVTGGVGDLSKTLSITRGLTSQQLLLLRQSASLHQHQRPTTASTTAPSPQTIGAQPATVQQKLSLPSGIEHLRATVASAASSVLPRGFAGIAATAGGAVKGLTGGRTTEEVIALLKQESFRMAASQSYKASHAASVAQFNPSAGNIQLTTKPQQTDLVKFLSTPAKTSGTSDLKPSTTSTVSATGQQSSSSTNTTVTLKTAQQKTTIQQTRPEKK